MLSYFPDIYSSACYNIHRVEERFKVKLMTKIHCWAKSRRSKRHSPGVALPLERLWLAG